jgi:Tol biopolymer transport system component/imidazolonepropionase-like amidohydrolase
VLRGFCVDRRLGAATALAIAGLGAQELPTTREIDVTLTEGTSMSAAASPDRRWIAIDLVGVLWLLPMRGGEARRLTPDTLEARQPAWSPDSESIAFQGYGADGTWHIYVVPRGGGDAKPLTKGEFDDREPAWSHDGSRVAFSSDRVGGVSSIWELALATGEVRRRSTRDGAMPAWSPDDREIAFISTDRAQSPGDSPTRTPGVYAVDPAGRERLVRFAPGGGAPSWSPDGSQLALVLGDRTLAAIPAYTIPIGDAPAHSPAGEVTAVARGEDVFPIRTQWLSRGELLYTADGRVKRRAIAGGTAATIPFTANVTLRRDSYTIAHHPLEPIDPLPLKGIVSPVISPNGRAIAFAALGDLWAMPVGGTPVRITNDAAVDLDPAWSPDGARLAFVSDRGGRMDVWLHDFGANADTQLTHERGGAAAPAWSPDGSEIAYVADGRRVRTARLFNGRCPAADGEPPTPNGIGRPSWSADCKSIAVGALFPYSNRYREGLNQLLVYAIDQHVWSESLLFPQHNAGNRQDTGPIWSPDGNAMAFATEGRLWTVATDGGGGATAPPRDVAADPAESPRWEGDSRHLVYQTPSGLRRVPAEGGPPDPIALDLRWRPSPPPERVVVHAGHLLDLAIEGLRGESDIVVERGIIRGIEPHRDDLHVGTVVDARDEYVIPGLIEMHAHLDPEYGSRFGRIWLAYGITSVRMPAVNPYAGLEQREAIESGRRPGPRLFIAGDPLDGIRSFDPGGAAIASDAQLDSELERASSLGVDFFQTSVRLPDGFQRRVVEYAHAHGRPVTSHELYPAVAFGADGIEQLAGTSRRGYTAKQSASARAYRDVIDLAARSGATLTPTIGVQGAYRARITGDKSLLYDPRLALFPLPLVADLSDAANARANGRLDAAIRPYEANLKAFAAAGVKIVAGTDSPIVPYGLGLHVELEAYVHAGMTPFQALQTATVNAAQALGLGDDLGTIEVGRVADLAFIGGDPLLDIRNTRDVKRVMKGGRVYTVAELLKP